MIRRPPRPTRPYTPLPYTALFRSGRQGPHTRTARRVRRLHSVAAAAAEHSHGTSRGHRQQARLYGGAGSHLDRWQPRWQGHFAVGRSEEHTSELQSLMRISYAVLCLKKKNNSTVLNTCLMTK